MVEAMISATLLNGVNPREVIALLEKNIHHEETGFQKNLDKGGDINKCIGHG